MGTNYYTTEDDLCSLCGRGGGDIHIGKSSLGWQFLFASHPDRGLVDHKSWREFLKTRTIKNEYGEVWAYDRFFDFVDLKQKKERLNGEVAYKENLKKPPHERPRFFSHWTDHEYVDPEGYRFTKGEFS